MSSTLPLCSHSFSDPTLSRTACFNCGFIKAHTDAFRTLFLSKPFRKPLLQLPWVCPHQADPFMNTPFLWWVPCSAFFICLICLLCILNPSLEDVTWHHLFLFKLLFRTCLKGALFMYYSWALLEIGVQISFIGHLGDCSRVLCTCKMRSVISWKVACSAFGGKMTVS